MDITVINPRGGEGVIFPLDENFQKALYGFCVRECVVLTDLEYRLVSQVGQQYTSLQLPN